MLRDKEISHIISGKSYIDLTDAVSQLGEHFGIRTLLLEGGGHINGAFLQADLVDELSLLVVPGIDGRHDIPVKKHSRSPQAQIRRTARSRCALDSLRGRSVRKR
jgi:riboflavin biosynthesis pyrimidine reductase